MTDAMSPSPSGILGRHKQKGITLVLALIALVVLLFSGVALMKSFESSSVLAGNLAFKRDMVNQAERGVATAIKDLRSGGNLATEAIRENDSLANNYSATILPSDSRGIPTQLIDDSIFSGTATDNTDSASGVTIRYLIDRQCAHSGTYSTEHCIVVPGGSTTPGGGHWTQKNKADSESQPVYRISVRVTGPRGTRAYAQATVTTTPP